MKLDLENLMAKVTEVLTAIADGEETSAVSLGHIDGVDYQFLATRNPEFFVVRQLHEDALSE